MTVKYLAKILIVFNLFYIVTYNSYFGWNLNPMSYAERVCDNIAHCVNIVAIIIYLLPLARIYESTTKKQEQ
jgi:uncharacterized membrane protein YphA (DoxX/SURF4 family)